MPFPFFLFQKLKTRFTLIFLTIALTACGSSSDNKSDQLETMEITTDLGVVSTTYLKDAQLLSFKGIPYAQAPIGDLRFAAPVAITEYSSTVNASEFGAHCPQDESVIEDASANEDCLFLNIYTPDVEGTYPVLFWIHGGAFVAGSGGEVYDPTRLVEQDVVVVTFNYRLGALGFLTHSDIGSGNWGLMDQQMALAWVEEHISNFGGDDTNITLFGESAGGHSVMSHIASPGAANLFHKAIVQSGHFSADQWSLETSGGIGGLIAAGAGCTEDVATCMRNVSVDDLLAAQTAVIAEHTGNSYFPVVDGVVLPDSFGNLISAGNYNQVPMLTGSTSDEGTFFTAVNELLSFQTATANGTDQFTAFLAAPITTQEEYIEAVEDLLALDSRNLDTSAIAARYLALEDQAEDTRFSLAVSAIQTDWLFACTALDFSNIFAEDVTTYMYRFSDQDAPSILTSEEGSLPLSGFPTGAAHGFDVQYLLASEEKMRDRGGDDAQIALSNAMIEYWTQFAKTGNPNGTGTSLTNWESFNTNTSNPYILELGTPSITASSSDDFAVSHQCDYWDNPPLNM